MSALLPVIPISIIKNKASCIFSLYIGTFSIRLICDSTSKENIDIRSWMLEKQNREKKKEWSTVSQRVFGQHEPKINISKQNKLKSKIII